MDLSAALIDADERYDHRAARVQALGPTGERLRMLVFTLRGDIVRAISSRKANPREAKRYEQET